MADALVRNWWVFALRGAAAIVFGVLVMAFPRIGLSALVAMFGVYALVYGVLTAWTAFSRRREEPYWGGLFVGGFFSVLAGVLAFVVPGITAIGLLMLIALWAIAIGMTEVVDAIRLREVVRNEWGLALSGLLSVVVGLALSMFPGAGALAVTLWIGAYAVVVGVAVVALGLRLRTWGLEHPAT